MSGTHQPTTWEVGLPGSGFNVSGSVGTRTMSGSISYRPYKTATLLQSELQVFRRFLRLENDFGGFSWDASNSITRTDTDKRQA